MTALVHQRLNKAFGSFDDPAEMAAVVSELAEQLGGEPSPGPLLPIELNGVHLVSWMAIVPVVQTGSSLRP